MQKTRFQSILITGASSGIGRALAERLSRPGVRITITGRDRARLDDAAGAIARGGAEVHAQIVDVVDRAAMRALIDGAEARAPLDLAVANAGISGGGGATDEEIVRDIFAVNLAGVLNTILPAAAAMRPRRKGQLAIVSSVAGFRGLPSAPAYSASKVAVRAWGDAVRPHLAEDGIGLSMIYPGFVESRMTAANPFPMPFLMSAERAADIIARGLQAGRREIAFPWQMVWMARLVASLPTPLFDAVMRRTPRKR